MGMEQKLAKDFQKLGFAITDFRVEGTNFDDATLRRINRISDLTTEAQAAQAVGLDYASIQKLEAMREAARNEGGGAGIGMGLGAGMGLGQSMAKSMGDNFSVSSDAGVTGKTDKTLEKLAQLKNIYSADLISDEEYTAKKKEILDSL